MVLVWIFPMNNDVEQHFYMLCSHLDKVRCYLFSHSICSMIQFGQKFIGNLCMCAYIRVYIRNMDLLVVAILVEHLLYARHTSKVPHLYKLIQSL